MDNDNYITYHYRFTFHPSGEKIYIPVCLDNKTLNLMSDARKSYPKWAGLAFCKCPHCPLDETKHKFCPLSAGLSGLVDLFKNYVSYEDVTVTVETRERTYAKHTNLQKGLSPLIGIYMVANGCPVMEKLKPMVRFHLPFASEEETKYRVLSMYLLAQYFCSRYGREPDWEMKKLIKIYEDIRLVNRYISKRLQSASIEDANINAIVILDCFADSVKFSIDKDMLDDLKIFFEAHLT